MLDLVLPILVLIASCVTTMIYTGGFFDAESGSYMNFVDAFANSDASLGLVLGAFIALAVTFVLPCVGSGNGAGKIHGLLLVGGHVNNMREVEVVVVGAGQAGLSSAYHLRRAGLEPDRDFVVLDHSPAPGGAWQFRWPSLTYGKVHGMHALPGMELTDADALRPSSEVIGAYFDRYERTFDLRVRRPLRPPRGPARP